MSEAWKPCAVHGSAWRNAGAARALRWFGLLALLPTLGFPFAWAAGVWLVLRAERQYVEARRELRGARPATLRIADGALLLDPARPRRHRRHEVRQGWSSPGREGETRSFCACEARALAMRVDATDALAHLGRRGRTPSAVLLVPLATSVAGGQGVGLHLPVPSAGAGCR